MRVLDENRTAIVLVEFADLVRLFLSKQHAAVVGSDDAIGVVRALPCDDPLCLGSNNAGNSGHRHLTELSGGLYTCKQDEHRKECCFRIHNPPGSYHRDCSGGL